MDDCRKCQTSTATPAEPGDLPCWVRAGSLCALMMLVEVSGEARRK